MIPRAHTMEPNRHEVMRAADGMRVEVQRWTRGFLRDVWYSSAVDLADNLAPWQGWQVVVHRSAWPLGESLRSAGLRAEALAGVIEGEHD